MMDADTDEAFMSEEEEDDSAPDSGEDEIDVGISMGMGTEDTKKDADDFQFSCLEPSQIVEYMCEIIREVTAIVHVSSVSTTTCCIIKRRQK